MSVTECHFSKKDLLSEGEPSECWLQGTEFRLRGWGVARSVDGVAHLGYGTESLRVKGLDTGLGPREPRSRGQMPVDFGNIGTRIAGAASPVREDTVRNGWRRLIVG